MARKVYITDEMGFDEDIADIAADCPMAAMMWAWMIPYFDDWGRGDASVRQIKTKVFPMFDHITAAVISDALDRFISKGKIVRYTVDGRDFLMIPPDKWFTYQTHIHAAKRTCDKSRFPAPTDQSPDEQLPLTRDSAQFRETPREPALDRASPSPSLSPSLSIDAPSVPEKGGRVRGSRIPEDWNPTPEAILMAGQKHPNVNLSRETEKFRNYWLAKAEKRVDWLACWRNWIINSEEYSSGRGESFSVAVSPASSPAVETPRKMSRQDEIARENGVNAIGLTNQTDPRQRDRDTILMVEKKAEEWGVSYDEAAQRVYEQTKREFPNLKILPVPPQPKERQRMAA